ILSGLQDRGIQNITIATGYRADELVAHIDRQFPSLDIQYVNNEHYETTNNIHSMSLALGKMQLCDDLILIESDLIYEPQVLDRLLASPYKNVALVDRYRSGMDGTVVTLDGSKVITQVIPPTLQPSDFSFIDKYKTLNIYRFSAEFVDTTLTRLLTYYAETFDDNCYYELILGILIYMQQAEIHAEVINGERWAEVDDPNDLRKAELLFSPARRYQALANGWGGLWGADVVDFNFIRNMYFPPPALLSELRHNLPALLQNYGSQQSILNEKLAWALQRDVGMVHALAGASQCYPWLHDWFGDKKVLIPEPTFGEYARMFPGAARYRDAPGIDWHDLQVSATTADVVVFVNPNNPTGSVIPTERIVALARVWPDKTIIVDESFIDFSDEPSIVDWLEHGDVSNIIVIKILSKGLGRPGIRLGGLFTTDREIAERVRTVTPIWNLSSVTESFLEILLKNRPAMENSYDETIRDREGLRKLLVDCPMVDVVFPSAANFLLARLRVSAAESASLAGRLLDKTNILVKDASGKFSDGRGYWRLAVRTPVDHELLADGMAAVVSDMLS
ncbi:MAG: aminotransferase class I/II-fold pyridoxal phosphate-dependent enzyme, partial [Thermomicrobiales bacterium]